MSALAAQAPYAASVLGHLEAQLASARQLLDLVLDQGRAVRERDVEGVLVQVAAIQAEMERRGQLERERSAVLLRSAALLGLPVAAVDLDALCRPLGPDDALRARTMSAELRGLLDEIVREHRANRALMRQELAFVDHLLRTLHGTDDPGYGPSGRLPATPRPPVRRLGGPGGLDLTA